MDHGAALFGGTSLTKKRWTDGIAKLEGQATEVSKQVEKVRHNRDYSVGRTDNDDLKEYEGSFQTAIRGVRAVKPLGGELVALYGHLDITQDVQDESGGALKVLSTRYNIRDARIKTPRSFDQPFIARWLQRGSGGEILVFTPKSTPSASEAVLKQDILPAFGPGIGDVGISFPTDPMVLLRKLGSMECLDRVESVKASEIRKEGEGPMDITQAFPKDAGRLDKFSKWLDRVKRDNFQSSVVSVRFRLSLDDAQGSNFRVDFRPGDPFPITVAISQRSDNLGPAYKLLTDAIAAVMLRGPRE